MIKEIDYGRDLIILDAGDFVGRKSYRQKRVAKLMFEVFGKMNYTGIQPGEQELSLGLPELKKLSTQYGVPIVCCNLIDNKSGKSVFNEFIIKPIKKKGLFGKRFKVGITGIIDPVFSRNLQALKKEDIAITPPEDRLKRIIPILKEKTDMIVLLSHLSQMKAFTIKEMFPNIDIIIDAHGSWRHQKKPFAPGSPMLLKEISKGKNLSWLRIFYDKKKKITNIESETLFLHSNLPEDPEISELIESFEKDFFPENKPTQNTQTYLTATNCRKCHLKEFSQWVKTPHARAFDSLVAKGKINDKMCLKCHVTGAGQHMGFGDYQSTPELINVQCESCHGPGKIHSIKPTKSYGQITHATCTRCHDQKNDPEFDYEKKLKKVVHRQ